MQTLPLIQCYKSCPFSEEAVVSHAEEGLNPVITLIELKKIAQAPSGSHAAEKRCLDKCLGRECVRQRESFDTRDLSSRQRQVEDGDCIL